MPELTETRRGRLVAELVGRELDAALVTDLVNVRYLTGFTGSNAAVLVQADGPPVLATDGRYAVSAAAECPDVERVISRDLAAAVLEAVGHRPGWRCGVETHVLSMDAYDSLAASVRDRGEWRLSSLDRAVEGLREVKDDTELAMLCRACEISTTALRELLQGQLAGRTERQLARDLEWAMYGHGAEAVGFETIVAAGPNSAIPHHSPGDRVVERGDLLKIDFGARYEGYHADCTRTVAVGAASDWQREIHAAVDAAQSAALDTVSAGVAVAAVDAAARESLERSGQLEHFTTGLGHGVGLEIHEEPFLTKRHPGRLRARTPVTIEPGIYLPGRGGVRIEDTVVVTDQGHDNLTAALVSDLLVLD